MAYIAPSDVVSAIIELMRDEAEAPLSNALIRRGPQRALRLGDRSCAVLVGLQRMAGGERSAGSSNNWWHVWQINLLLLVPENTADPQAAELLRESLLEQVLDLLHGNRAPADGIRRWNAVSVELFLGRIFENDQQIYRGVEIISEYQTLQS